MVRNKSLKDTRACSLRWTGFFVSIYFLLAITSCSSVAPSQLGEWGRPVDGVQAALVARFSVTRVPVETAIVLQEPPGLQARLRLHSCYASGQEQRAVARPPGALCNGKGVQDTGQDGRAVSSFDRGLGATPTRHIQNGIRL